MSESAFALREMQQCFATALRDEREMAPVLTLLSGDAARNRALLDIYRGNAVGNVAKALSLAFPVVRLIVGDEFFDGLARACWHAHPSRSGDLDLYGACFADFLSGFEHVRLLPYLPEVAQLEWCVHRLQTEVDHRAATLDVLSAVAPAQVGELRMSVQPGMRILESAWPLATIWQQHQPGFAGEVDVDLDMAECVLIHRRGWRVEVMALAPAEAALWRTLAAGASLAAALEAAFAVDAGLDVAQAIQSGFQRELVIAVSDPTIHSSFKGDKA